MNHVFSYNRQGQLLVDGYMRMRVKMEIPNELIGIIHFYLFCF